MLNRFGPAKNAKLEYQRWYRHTERGHQLKLIAGVKARIKHRIKRLAYSKIYHLRRVYGLTPEIYKQILMKQNASCPICLRKQKDVPRTFSVDHNHVTKQIRGLLCTRCNGIILRLVEYERDKINRAINYLDNIDIGIGRNWNEAK